MVPSSAPHPPHTQHGAVVGKYESHTDHGKAATDDERREEAVIASGDTYAQNTTEPNRGERARALALRGNRNRRKIEDSKVGRSRKRFSGSIWLS